MVCRICLETEGTMERVSEELEAAYREVIGIKWDRADQHPQHLCWECAARLRAAARLRRRALTSHRLLSDLRAEHHSLTLSDIKLIDRRNHYLTSSLSLEHLPPNEYITETINNKQIYPTDNSETNTKYTELTLGTIKTIDRIEKIDFANIVTNLIRNKTDISIKETKSTAPDNVYAEGNFTKQRNIESEAIVNEIDSSEKSFEKNLVPYKSNSDNLNVQKDFDVNTEDFDDDSSSDSRLVIDAGDEEPMETIISSEYVNRTAGGTPIDELIDVYKNNGDGDEILQELNQQFEGAAEKTDQGLGSGGEGAASALPEVATTQTRKRKGRRSKRRDSIGILNGVDRAEYCLSMAYEKLDPTLFTITLMTEEEQIAEVLKRQETYRFKRAPFKCGLCFRGFSAQRAHATHMLRHDEINGAFECVVCKSRLKSPRAVTTHMCAQHTVRVSCKRCSFVTMNRNVAWSHEQWHAGTVHECPHCPARFDQDSKLKCHLRTQHAHRHSCALCGLAFNSVKGLAVHRCKRHADAKKIPLEGPYCEVCGVRFAMEEAYATHFRMSSLHRPDNVPRYIGLRDGRF